MLNQAKTIFIVGIKGVAMSNLAVILKKMGKDVTGSDVSEEFITAGLLKINKISWQTGFNPKSLPKNTDLVIYSAAHQGINNPQIAEAKKKGMKIISQAELLGQLTKQFKTTIAVCGCHGKTTTSSLLSYALIKLGVRPSYMVGSSSFNQYLGGDFNAKDYFVVEADEYGVNPPHDLTPKFHLLNPNYILCTNIDFDHPDVYKNINSVKESFLKFFKKNTILDSGKFKIVNKNLILCADDKNLLDIAKKLPRKSYLTYGYSKDADLQITNSLIENNYSSFELQCHPEFISGSDSKKKMLNHVQHDRLSLGRFAISLFGEKNISNTAGVALTLLNLGFDPEKIKLAIKGFNGAKRRFEKVYYGNNIYLFDDYAHHPNEIKASISAARSHFPQKRIVIVFQPHTYSRTQTLLKDFSTSLSLADKAFILPIFASARENPKQFNISSKDIEKVQPGNNIMATSSKKELFQLLTSHLKPHDIVFTMGAGDVYKLKDDIIDIVRKIK